MKNFRGLINLTFFFLLAFSLVACETVQPTTTEPLPSSTPASVTPTTATQPTSSELPPTSTLSPILETPTSVGLPIEYPQPGTVVLDFVAQACRADWANGALHIPCPGNLNDLAEGFVTPADQAIAEGEIPVNAPVLIALPGSGNTHGAALFGKYQPLLFQTGDTFHAVLACQEGTSCDVEFALEYFDAQGKYHPEMGWSWKHQYGGGPVTVQVDLSPLAGQNVQLTLVVRDLGTPLDDWVLWIYPYVANVQP